MKKIAEKTRDQIRLFYELETNRPFTLSHKTFSDSKNENFIDLVHHRNQTNSSALISRTSHTTRDRTGNFRYISQDEVTDDVLIGHLNARGYRVTEMKQLAPLHGPDEYEPELTVISMVWAYFRIASKRIMDIVPMIIEVVFARHFGRELSKVLVLDLDLVGNEGVENCARYTKDADDVDQKRTKLSRDKSTLLAALEILRTA